MDVNKIFEENKLDGDSTQLNDLLKNEFQSIFGDFSMNDESCITTAEKIQYLLLEDTMEEDARCIPEVLGKLDNDIFYITGFSVCQLSSQRQVDIINRKLSENYNGCIYIDNDIFNNYEEANYLKCSKNVNLNLDKLFDSDYDKEDIDLLLSDTFDFDKDEVMKFIYQELRNRDIVSMSTLKVKNVWVLEIKHHAGNEMNYNVDRFALAVH